MPVDGLASVLLTGTLQQSGKLLLQGLNHVAQVLVGVLAKAQGLVADGIHSLSELVADFVVLFASHHSKKDADEDHPYGHQRFETAASFVLSVLLLGPTKQCCDDQLNLG